MNLALFHILIYQSHDSHLILVCQKMSNFVYKVGQLRYNRDEVGESGRKWEYVFWKL